MTRAEHLEWAKKRALAVLEGGDVPGAFTSMASDLRKHAELADHVAIMLGFQMLMGGHLGSPGQMRSFIDGFN